MSLLPVGGNLAGACESLSDPERLGSNQWPNQFCSDAVVGLVGSEWVVQVKWRWNGQ